MDAKKIFKIPAMVLVERAKLVKQQPKAIRGKGREALLESFLKPFLPERLGLGGGVIVPSKGKNSGEVDIVIYDKDSYGLFRPFAEYMPIKAKPYPIEVVYAVIEVESNLTKKKLKKIANKLDKIKKMRKTAFYERKGAVKESIAMYGKTFKHFPVLCFIFAYESENLEEIGDVLKTINAKKEMDQKIDAICVLNRGVIIYHDETENSIGIPNTGMVLKYLKQTPAEALQTFYLIMIGILSQAKIRPIRVLDYFEKEE